ncbi:hypothetical protein E5288_WYG016242 [Bos mutus]|uniref:Secreted protein n=1 Tax=Bos mutus TaxID=72004 RepID=A0A6B0RLN4_9CETA|nr:hypothetical protein [Bos mutus]
MVFMCFAVGLRSHLSTALDCHSINRVIYLTVPLDLLRMTSTESRGTAPCLVPENDFRKHTCFRAEEQTRAAWIRYRG